MTRSTVLLLAACLLPCGCGDLALAGPDEAAPAASLVGDHGAEMVPITWKYEVAFSGTDLIVCTNSDGSAPFMAVPANYTMTGHVSHLGVLDAGTSATMTTCTVTIAGGIPVSAAADTQVELIGANGDAILLEGVLRLVFAETEMTGEWSVTGGTGRFAGASGWLTTSEAPNADGSGSVGGGAGMITPPGMLKQ